MIVLDTSAVIAVLADPDPPAGLRERVVEAGSLHVPHLLDTECLSALRRLVRGGVLPLDRAEEVLADLAQLPLVRYPAEPLSARVWALRENFTAYDGTFIALAELLGCALVTCDRKLSSAAHQAVVEVYS